MLKVDVSVGQANIKEFLDRCRELSTQTDQLLQEALVNSCQENIVVVAKSLAPVKTGALRESIDTLPGDTPLTAILVATKHYAPFLEFGTRYIPEGKFSFLRPAIAMQTEKVVEDVGNALREQLGQL